MRSIYTFEVESGTDVDGRTYHLASCRETFPQFPTMCLTHPTGEGDTELDAITDIVQQLRDLANGVTVADEYE